MMSGEEARACACVRADACACAMKRSKSYTWLAGLLRREREPRDGASAGTAGTDADDAPWVRAHLSTVDR